MRGEIASYTRARYNAGMGDEIYEYLSPEQVRRLAELLRFVCDVGHGSVTIRAKNHKIRFVAVDVEGEFGVDGTGVLDQLTDR